MYRKRKEILGAFLKSLEQRCPEEKGTPRGKEGTTLSWVEGHWFIPWKCQLPVVIWVRTEELPGLRSQDEERTIWKPSMGIILSLSELSLEVY